MYDDFLERNLNYIYLINYDKFQKLNTEEKYSYLIKKNILVKTKKHKVLFGCVYDSVPIVFKDEPFNFGNLYDYKGFDYEINQKIKDEFYDYFFVRIELELLLSNPLAIINSIKQETKYLTNISKKKVLLKYYDKYSEIFSHYCLELDYLNSQVGYIENWESYIKDYSEEDIFYYLSGIKVDYEYESSIEKWIEIKESSTIISFCINEFDRMNLNIHSTNKKASISNYPLVFPNLKMENLFFDFLKKHNGLDQNNKPRDSVFKPLCDAFYNMVKECQHDKHINYPNIILTGRNKNKFIEMLIHKFEISKKFTKLSDGSNYKDLVLKYLNNKFENIEE